jgi:hypothetical protein
VVTRDSVGSGGALKRRAARSPRRAAAAALLAGACAAAHAGVLRYCDAAAELTAAQQDTLFRFGAVVRDTLERSGHDIALVARSGLDLGRFGVRYSHAGLSLRASPNAPWSVRQLYYDCDERRPRLFDQGIAGFVLGTVDPSAGYVSAVLLPPAAAVPLERAAQDKRQALSLLGSTYSANAYPFAQRYQNCNQWVAELMAVAWGGLPEAGEGPERRAQAQRWLQAQGFTPTRFDVGNPILVWLGVALPWLHGDDHPPEDLRRQRFHVSMPGSIEAFVQARVPGARRLEFCHDGRRVVVRKGWEPIADGCRPGPEDTVVALD